MKSITTKREAFFIGLIQNRLRGEMSNRTESYAKAETIATQAF
jgi:hypothetical protein